jgi:hypothetical protein
MDVREDDEVGNADSDYSLQDGKCDDNATMTTNRNGE